MKMKMYERMGVQEYLVAITGKEKLIWKTLGHGAYQDLDPEADGIFRSRCFAGLWLDAAALWQLDLKRMLAVLQESLASPEYAAFVARLATLGH